LNSRFDSDRRCGKIGRRGKFRRIKRMTGNENKYLKTHEDLAIYQLAFESAMKIFEYSKKFPVEEKYSLTDQIRRSSTSPSLFFFPILY
jgi:hypothetical protein